MRRVGEGEQVGKQAIVAIPHTAPKHPVMGLCVSTQWPFVTSYDQGRPALLRATGEAEAWVLFQVKLKLQGGL